MRWRIDESKSKCVCSRKGKWQHFIYLSCWVFLLLLIEFNCESFGIRILLRKRLNTGHWINSVRSFLHWSSEPNSRYYTANDNVLLKLHKIAEYLGELEDPSSNYIFSVKSNLFWVALSPCIPFFFVCKFFNFRLQRDMNRIAHNKRKKRAL